MRVFAAADLHRVFAFPPLIEALREAFRRGAVVAPTRHHHAIVLPGEPDATLLLMPAWDDAGRTDANARSLLGVKVVAVYPGNAARGLASVNGAYILMRGDSGIPLAVMDGQALTLWRTAAASALAASYLAAPDAARLVMVGAGALAPFLIAAHASVRPISDVRIWNRNFEKAEALAEDVRGALTSPLRGGRDLRAEGEANLGRGEGVQAPPPDPLGAGMKVQATSDLEGAVRQADVVSCATLSPDPLVNGAWLKPGAHLDLVGAYAPNMRESDDDAARRARIYVDTRAGALKEGGDIVLPLAAGVISGNDIVGDLFDLCRGAVAGRRAADEITLFKSVGAAIEDLAAAALAFGMMSPDRGM